MCAQLAATFPLAISCWTSEHGSARAQLSLPQLPITTDAEGYLVARSDFTVPVGPSYFERDSSKDYKEGDR